MNHSNKFVVMPSHRASIDKDTSRYYSIMYVCFNNQEYYAYVSCSSYTLTSMDELAIEFLNHKDYSSEPVPFDAELFNKIEDEALKSFNDILITDIARIS